MTNGLDPSEAKIEKASAAKDTFAAIGAELAEKKRREGKSGATVGKTEWLLTLASPALGNRPIKEITAPEILAVLRTSSRAASSKPQGGFER